MAGLAVDVDVAVVLPDDAVDHGHAQTGPFSHFLGREEGFEDLSQDLFVHAAARVAHDKADIVSGGVIGVIGTVGLVKETF